LCTFVFRKWPSHKYKINYLQIKGKATTFPTGLSGFLQAQNTKLNIFLVFQNIWLDLFSLKLTKKKQNTDTSKSLIKAVLVSHQELKINSDDEKNLGCHLKVLNFAS